MGFQLLLLLWLIQAAASQDTNLFGCTEKCGNVTIPSQFGIEPGCYQNSWFIVTCKETVDGKKPFIARIGLELIQSISDSNVVVNSSVTYLNCKNKVNKGNGVNLEGSPFYFPARCQEARPPKPDCTEKCGNVDIEFQFGIKAGCYFNDCFRVTCKEKAEGQVPFLNKFDLELFSVSFFEGNVRVRHPVTYSNYHQPDNNGASADLRGSPFYFSNIFNRFVSFGCSSLATISHSHNKTGVIGGCVLPSCGSTSNLSFQCWLLRYGNSSRYHFLCYEHDSDYNGIGSNNINNRSCGSAFMMDMKESLLDQYGMIADSNAISQHTHVITALQWATMKAGLCDLNDGSTSDIFCSSIGKYCWKNMSSTYLCVCSNDESTSFSTDVCRGTVICFVGMLVAMIVRIRRHALKDMNMITSVIGSSTSFGTLFFLLGSWNIYKVLKRRRNIKLKRKYFKRNGGLLLQQQLSRNEGSNGGNIRFFTSKELERATDYYNENRILGQGGQGTVYKGMLVDGSIVAIKKSKMVDLKKKKLPDEKQLLEQFVNEVMILSQINHRNVVKLLGCCLETQFPLLVYEFIPNGTLSQLIHEQNEDFPLTWEMRLLIGTEVANALSYLHSAASVPIYHRDIKSTNILLDDKYRAKVSDFGTSRSVALEQTHLATRSEDEETRSLVTCFLLSMNENSLLDILDPRVKHDSPEKEITAVAKLAKRCLNLNGKKRPTIKQVAAELELI
ncbi:hypothetical protein COLO4_09304 [Corchorus olitorius]|uniref:Protein kinase domain-containing protein n=1 Tax=Corchorus olitorius TaxID=93759 RepID=A0A1R3KCH1_9ROSI|nr:hypothetical protein COLO4_09304 [Corchorus olitorius]